MTELSINTPSTDRLHCRVQVSPQEIEGFHLDVLVVEVWCPEELDRRDSKLQIEIVDITEGVSHACTVRDRQTAGDAPGEVFSRERLFDAIPTDPSSATLPTTVQIDTRQLYFARRGRRHLAFKVTLLSKHGLRLVDSWDEIEYDNRGTGYLEWYENCEHVRLLTAPLIGSLTAQQLLHLNSNQNGLLRGWLLAGIDLSVVSTKAKRTFERKFKKLLKACEHIDSSQIVALRQDIKSRSTIGQRQEILEFCIHLVCRSECVSAKLWFFLQEIACLWDIDTCQFLSLLEKILSTDKLRDVDPMILVGMARSMSKEQRLKQLNGAYARWNARITHTDKVVRQQAEEMLSWIAQSREHLQGC